TGYGGWLHGEAVAAGMVVATRLAVTLGLCPPEAASRIENLVRRSGLPTRLPPFAPALYLESMSHDKKVSGGRMRFILPAGIGTAVMLDDIPVTRLESVLLASMGENPILPNAGGNP
ncbi:MAG: 3-dehydroquinate synthase, partial [Magnetococcales bacterium]|nr:3-dehydroquinate synthase [Magnetococcales bacterium]